MVPAIKQRRGLKIRGVDIATQQHSYSWQLLQWWGGNTSIDRHRMEWGTRFSDKLRAGSSSIMALIFEPPRSHPKHVMQCGPVS
jgi:hypothetical protein